eukprot:8307519-Pyramimonas_sp.AAC.1
MQDALPDAGHVVDPLFELLHLPLAAKQPGWPDRPLRVRRDRHEPPPLRKPRASPEGVRCVVDLVQVAAEALGYRKPLDLSQSRIAEERA